jgi:ribosomal-protein-alanine N-acetyltransferase
VREGYAREYLCINGTWQDHLLYGQLNDDPKSTGAKSWSMGP